MGAMHFHRWSSIVLGSPRRLMYHYPPPFLFVLLSVNSSLYPIIPHCYVSRTLSIMLLKRCNNSHALLEQWYSNFTSFTVSFNWQFQVIFKSSVLCLASGSHGQGQPPWPPLTEIWRCAVFLGKILPHATGQGVSRPWPSDNEEMVVYLLHRIELLVFPSIYSPKW